MTPTEQTATGQLLREEIGAIHGLLTTNPGRQAYIVAFVFDGKTGKGQVISQSNIKSALIRRSIVQELRHRIALLLGGENKREGA